MVTTANRGTPIPKRGRSDHLREYQGRFRSGSRSGRPSYWKVQQYAALDPPTPERSPNCAHSAPPFTGAAEFTNRYGAAWTPSTLITPANGSALVSALYTNILGRSPDPAGLSYWLNAKVTVSQLLASFAQAAEFIADSNAA